MTRQIPEQIRAADASARATEVSERPSVAFKKEYLSYVNRIGPTILMNGLGQALAIELAAAGGDATSAHQVLYWNISNWLCREGGVYTCTGETGVIHALIAGTQDDYLRAQSEALAWVRWHKRFCRAVLPEDRKDVRAESV